ncbi:MAG: hypothetical protein AAGD43_25485 [Pseudomonadota bacterium]
MIWLRRLSWCVMWAGLLIAVLNHQDVLAGMGGLSTRVFTGAVLAIAIGLLGIYITRRPGDSGFGF